jgi:hypothetical protein
MENNMIHILKEGNKLHNGFNFYPLSDTRSFGFKVRYGKKIPMTELGSKLFVFRFSKLNKKWIVKFEDYSSVTGYMATNGGNIFNEGLQAYIDEQNT